MVQQIKWKYCSKTTKQHPICLKSSTFIEEIDSVCKNDGAKKTPFSNEICLNLDKLENELAKLQKRNSSKTMDFYFCITRGKSLGVVLCELRLNYKNPNNLSKSELDKKISDSIRIIGHTPSILKPYIFVFNSKIKNQALSKIRRLYANKKFATALDLNDLYRYYFI